MRKSEEENVGAEERNPCAEAIYTPQPSTFLSNTFFIRIIHTATVHSLGE